MTKLRRLLFLSAAIVAFLDHLITADELRTWMDSTGKFKVSATLDSQAEGVVILRSIDGKTYRVRADRLSESDQRYLQSRVGDSKVAGSIDAEHTRPIEAKFNAVEFTIAENGQCKVVVDSTPALPIASAQNQSVPKRRTPTRKRLADGSTAVRWEFAAISDVESLIPKDFPDDLKIRMRNQLSHSSELGAIELSPARTTGRIPFDINLPAKGHLPLSLRFEFAEFNQGRFAATIGFPPGNFLVIALHQEFEGAESGTVLVEWRTRKDRNNPVDLEKSPGWETLLRFVQRANQSSEHSFELPSAFKRRESDLPCSVYFGILGREPIQLRAIEFSSFDGTRKN